MTQEKETEYKAVRGLIRGLALINTLSHSGGELSINQLSQQSGLHRTTVRRLLETLQQEGYIQRNSSDSSLYQLTLRVRELSEGFRDEQWISALAAPLLGNLLQKVLWPTDLCTLDGDAMLIRETTHKFSRLSFHSAMVGRRLPMLHTSVGRAYLAFCPDEERENILNLLAAREDEDAGSDLDFLVELEKDRSLVDLVGVKQDFEALFGAPVDVFTRASLKPAVLATARQDLVRVL